MRRLLSPLRRAARLGLSAREPERSVLTKSSRFRAHGSSGFTLIELMVALTGGLFFTIFVFMLTRDASRFFQRESRISDTTLAAITGFQRLRADIARGGFLASPNLPKDPKRCPPANAENAPNTGFQPAWSSEAAELRKMAALRIIQGGSAVSGNFVQTENGLNPDSLILYGNYTSAEQFPVRSIRMDGASYTVFLEPQSGAMSRAGYDPSGNAATLLSLVQQLFPEGRALRLVNQEGEEQYGIIDSVTVGGSGMSPTITLKSAPPLQFKSESSTTCGLRGHAAGVQVNPVNIIQYQLRNLNTEDHPQFAYLFQGERPTYDNHRLDLVRTELTPAGDLIEGSEELVAEYVVDLKFGLSVLEDPQTLRNLVTFPPSSTEIPKYAGPPETGSAAALNFGPHLIRGVHARLAVRTIDTDRQGDVILPEGASGGLYRVKLANTTPPSYARVRTLQAWIATHNTRNKQWR